MSQFTKETHGIMGLTLSQIGLFLATGILLTAVLSFIFFNNWQRTSELHSIANDFSALIEDVDLWFFEDTTEFQFPAETYPYTIRLSQEYITAATEDFWGRDFHVTERFLRKPWIRSSLENWTTGDDLHEYLNATFGHPGVKDDPISLENFTVLRQEQNTSSLFYSVHPLEILSRDPVILEKVIIFYDNGQKYDFVLVYQSG
jgi:hypothetical protein